MKGARDLGLSNAYVPTLRLTHYLRPERFTLKQAIRAAIANGRSLALYEQIVGVGSDPLATLEKSSPLLVAWNNFKRERHRSVRYAVTHAACQWAYELTRWALERDCRNGIKERSTEDIIETAGRIIVRGPGVAQVTTNNPEWVVAHAGVVPEQCWISPGSKIVDAKSGQFLISSPRMPWQYAAVIAVARGSGAGPDQCILVVKFQVLAGEIGVGLLDRSRKDFIFQRLFSRRHKDIELHILVRALDGAGPLVFLNWERGGHSRAVVESISICITADLSLKNSSKMGRVH